MAVQKLGARVRRFREEKNLSQEDLAAAANLSVEVIKDLEDDGIYPSLAPIQKVARALGIRLGTFMDDVSVSDPLIVRKARREDDLTMHKSKGKEAAFHFHSLGKGKADRNMEPFVIEMISEPEADHRLSSHEGEEFILVTQGKVLLRYGKEDNILEPGDTAYYNSIVPHYVGAVDGEAQIYAVIYYPPD
jgi:transcriptional regulator with XRE-family HTH domain